MKKGKVKFFNREKRFGFITEHESGKDYFVHESGCTDVIADGDEVTFEIGEGKNGPMAVNVQQDTEA
ncbi:MAG: cold shock domain-containing protein [Flavobacteriales bacterium]|nr:cold shock domain-containing protein [Flavobacteriales bacterium]